MKLIILRYLLLTIMSIFLEMAAFPDVQRMDSEINEIIIKFKSEEHKYIYTIIFSPDLSRVLMYYQKSGRIPIYILEEIDLLTYQSTRTKEFNDYFAITFYSYREDRETFVHKNNKIIFDILIASKKDKSIVIWREHKKSNFLFESFNIFVNDFCKIMSYETTIKFCCTNKNSLIAVQRNGFIRTCEIDSSYSKDKNVITFPCPVGKGKGPVGKGHIFLKSEWIHYNVIDVKKNREILLITISADGNETILLRKIDDDMSVLCLLEFDPYFHRLEKEFGFIIRDFIKVNFVRTVIDFFSDNNDVSYNPQRGSSHDIPQKGNPGDNPLSKTSESFELHCMIDGKIINYHMLQCPDMYEYKKIQLIEAIIDGTVIASDPLIESLPDKFMSKNYNMFTFTQKFLILRNNTNNSIEMWNIKCKKGILKYYCVHKYSEINQIVNCTIFDKYLCCISTTKGRIKFISLSDERWNIYNHRFFNRTTRTEILLLTLFNHKQLITFLPFDILSIIFNFL